MLETKPTPATLEDLYREPGKAELIAGRIVRFMPTGFKPGRVAFRIARSLDDHAEEVGRGHAVADGVGFAVLGLRSGRESFCPDAAFVTASLPPETMRFIEGAPAFAAEVRSEGDYGPSAEVALALKRADYFEAGTLAVWDVDPVSRRIHLYLTPSDTPAQSFGPREIAHAEPAVPGWRVPVDWLFA